MSSLCPFFCPSEIANQIVQLFPFNPKTFWCRFEGFNWGKMYWEGKSILSGYSMALPCRIRWPVIERSGEHNLTGGNFFVCYGLASRADWGCWGHAFSYGDARGDQNGHRKRNSVNGEPIGRWDRTIELTAHFPSLHTYHSLRCREQWLPSFVQYG